HTQLSRRDRLRYLDADSLSRPGQLKVQQDFTGLIPESECLFLITQLQGEALTDIGAERSGFQQYLQVAGDRCRQLQIDIGGIRPAAKRLGVGQAINPSEHSWPGRSAEIDDVRRVSRIRLYSPMSRVP